MPHEHNVVIGFHFFVILLFETVTIGKQKPLLSCDWLSFFCNFAL